MIHAIVRGYFIYLFQYRFIAKYGETPFKIRFSQELTFETQLSHLCIPNPFLIFLQPFLRPQIDARILLGTLL